jgi:hypothetical protein
MKDYYIVCCTTVFCYLPEYFNARSIKKGMKDYVDAIGLYNDITEPKYVGNCWQAELIIN